VFKDNEAEFGSVILEQVTLLEEIKSELGRYTELYLETHANLIRLPDYARWSFVLEKIPDNSSILDVGVGVGQFVNAAARSGRFAKVSGLDIRQHPQFISSEIGDVDISYENARNMSFKSQSYDYVTCMEVIEHLDTDEMMDTISELRRIAKEKILITIPYCEKEPIPSYHKQRFTISRIQELFPNGDVKLCTRDRWIEWAYIEEEMKPN